MWKLDHKEGWASKNWCFFELWCWRRLLRVPWTVRKSNQSILKEINPEYSLEGDAETEAPIFWPPDAKSQVIGKDPDPGKDWGQEKGEIEDKTVGWHHRLNGHEFEQTLGDSEGQGSLVCCSPWGHKDMTYWLNNNSKGCLRYTHPYFQSSTVHNSLTREAM